MNKFFIKGTITITFATFISKFLGSFFQIPLQNIAGDEVLGIFRMVYPIYMIVLYLSTAGIPLALSKMISELKATGDEDQIPILFKTAQITAIVFGVFYFIIFAGFSGFISNAIGEPETERAILMVSFTLLLAPYMAVYRGYFQGFEMIGPTAYSQMLEQLIRISVGLIIAFVFVKWSATSSVVAGNVMISSFFGVIVSWLYLQIRYHIFSKNNMSKPYSWNIFLMWLKKILFLSIPIAFSSLTLALFQLVDSFTIPHVLKANGQDDVQYLFGVYSRGLSISQIVIVFASGVILQLIPLISREMKSGNKQEAKSYIERAFLLTHLISWPAALGLVALSLPINLTLFMDLNGSFTFAFNVFASLFMSYTTLTVGMLQGLNRQTLTAWILVGGAVLKGICNIIFVDLIGISGAALANVMIYLVIAFVLTIIIKQDLKTKIQIKPLIYIVLSTIIMSVIVSTPLYFIAIQEWDRMDGFLYLLITIPIGAVFYLATIWIKKSKLFI